MLPKTLGILQQQIETHRKNLEERAATLIQAKTDAEALNAKLSEIERQYAVASKEAQALDEMLLFIVKTAKPAVKAMQAELTQRAEFEKSLKLPDLPFLAASSPIAAEGTEVTSR